MLKSPEHSLRELVELSPLAIVEIDREGKIKLWNPAAERMFGWAESEVLGRAYPAVPSETRAEFEDDVLHLLKGATIRGKEVRRQRKDGRRLDVKLWAAPIHNQQNEITGITAILEDSTDQKENERKLRVSQAREEEMEAQLQRSEERMRLAFDAAKIGYWDWNLVTGEMVWSAAASRQMGLPEESPTGLEIFMDSVHPDDRKAIEEAGEAAVHDNKNPDVPYRMLWPDGSVHWRSVTGRVFHDKTGRPVRMVGIGMDLDESKVADERLLLQAAALQAAANSIVITDNRGTILWTNEAFSQLTGYSAEEVLGKNLRLLKSGEQDSAFYTNMWATITSGNIWQGELTNRRKDGSLYTEEMTITPVLIGNGEITHYVAIKQDITSRKIAEDKLRQAELQYRLLFESNPLPMWVFDCKTLKFLAVNEAAIRQYGFSKQEFLAMTIADIRPEEDIPRLLKATAQPIHGLQEAELWRHRRKDGAILDVEIVSHDLDFQGIQAELVAPHDVTKRKQAEDALRRAEEKYRSIFEDAVIGIFQTTPDGRPVSINRALARMLGYDSPERLLAEVSNVGRQLFVDPNAMQELARVLEKDRAVHSVELEVYSKDGGKKWLSANVRAVSDAEGKVVLHEGTVEDITERKAAEERAQFLAYYDALTGLPNRTLLRDRILMALPSARRHREKVALLFLDLDNFKTINDLLGHSIGDLLLQEVAERLKRWTREQDTVARLGGDEFLVLVTAVNETANAVVVAERIVNSMAAEIVIQGHVLNVTCSLGISIFPDNGEEVDALLKNADLAMYKAKENGRNNFQLFTQQMNVQLLERMTLERSLRLAVEKKEFFLVYQPQMDLATGEIIGCEALIRWKHPELGLVLPNTFIPLAESSGLIGPMGEWVLKTACAQARQWQDEGLPAVPVAVNVSAVQFRHKGFLRLVQTVLREAGLAPQYLELELTESLLLSNADVMLIMLQQLKEMGLKLSIDDFGTGYSSLSYLRQFPVYKLKIDHSFVRDIAVDPDGAVITSTIISMAKSLGLKVLAEGVETEEQVSFLRAHDCHEIQGYYFSKPLCANEFADKLRGHLPGAASPSRDGR